MKNHMQKQKFRKKSVKNYVLNSFVKCGKKAVAENILLKTFKEIQKQEKKSAKSILKLAIIKNLIVVNNKLLKKKSLSTINIPYVLKKKNRMYFAIKNILTQSSKKRSYYLHLTKKVLDSTKINNLQDSVKLQISQISFLNKKFAHYRWFL